MLRLRPMDDHRDDRGYVVNPFEHLASTGEVTHCHALSVEPGAARGDHVHPERNEELLVLAGELSVTDTGTGESLTLTAASPAVLELAPGVPHVIRNRGEATAVALCWSSRRVGGK